MVYSFDSHFTPFLPLHDVCVCPSNQQLVSFIFQVLRTYVHSQALTYKEKKENLSVCTVIGTLPSPQQN